MQIPIMNNKLSFDKAFAGARSLNVSAFVWKGNRYHTRRYDDPEEIRRRKDKEAKLMQPIGWIDA